MVCGWDETGPQLYYSTTTARGSTATSSASAPEARTPTASSTRTCATTSRCPRPSTSAAAPRDAYSGGWNNLYHMKETGWEFIGAVDTNDLYYEHVHPSHIPAPPPKPTPSNVPR